MLKPQGYGAVGGIKQVKQGGHPSSQPDIVTRNLYRSPGGLSPYLSAG